MRKTVILPALIAGLMASQLATPAAAACKAHTSCKTVPSSARVVDDRAKAAAPAPRRAAPNKGTDGAVVALLAVVGLAAIAANN